MAVKTCKYHNLKPAKKICWNCKEGLCGNCGHIDINKQYYYCDECKPEMSRRGVIKF